MSQTVVVRLRLPRKLYDNLVREARAQNITLALHIRKILFKRHTCLSDQL